FQKQRALESPFEVNRADCGPPAHEIRERALGGFTVRRDGRTCAEPKEHDPPTPPAISFKFAVRASVVHPDARSVDDRSVLPNKLEHFPSPDRIGLSFLTNRSCIIVAVSSSSAYLRVSSSGVVSGGAVSGLAQVSGAAFPTVCA